MVLPVKVFEIRGLEGNPLDKLTGWRELEQVEDEDDLQLVTEIIEVEGRRRNNLRNLRQGLLQGTHIQAPCHVQAPRQRKPHSSY